jgi:hypothetical protein
MDWNEAMQVIDKMAADGRHRDALLVASGCYLGRRVWLQECDKGRGDQALLLLADVFGHANIATTKRYLGIRQEEILSVYDSLDN